jgi:hypothetical protein
MHWSDRLSTRQVAMPMETSQPLIWEMKMTKEKQSGGGNKQSAEQSGNSSGSPAKAKAGKDAASHTKADTGKGAGGGKKQARKH